MHFSRGEVVFKYGINIDFNKELNSSRFLIKEIQRVDDSIDIHKQFENISTNVTVNHKTKSNKNA